MSRLNPEWNQTDVKASHFDAQFLKAVALTGEDLLSEIRNLMEAWLPARKIVEEAMKDRFKHHSSGQVVVLQQATMWKSHLKDLESELKIEHHKDHKGVLYVLFPDVTSQSWRIQCVPTDSNFVSRKSLPQEWRGLSGESFQKKVPNGIFVHANGFMGGHQTLEGALQMAQTALVSSETIYPVKVSVDDQKDPTFNLFIESKILEANGSMTQQLAALPNRNCFGDKGQNLGILISKSTLDEFPELKQKVYQACHL